MDNETGNSGARVIPPEDLEDLTDEDRAALLRFVRAVVNFPVDPVATLE